MVHRVPRPVSSFRSCLNIISWEASGEMSEILHSQDRCLQRLHGAPGCRHFDRVAIALKIEPRPVGNHPSIFFVAGKSNLPHFQRSCWARRSSQADKK